MPALLEARPDATSLNLVVWKVMNGAKVALAKTTLLEERCVDAIRALTVLTSAPRTARALISQFRWIELHLVGSAQQRHSVLGPFFRYVSLELCS